MALASLLVGPTSASAATQSTTQTLPHSSETVLVANLGTILRDINRGVQQVQREIERQQREQERREREAVRQQQIQEQEADRQAAAERQRLEAERERQYFESLTPEQQQAYMAERRARQAAQAEMMTELFILLIGSGDDAGNSSNSNTMDDCLRLGIRSRACGTD